MRRPQHWWPFYVGWIALCAILFVALSDLEDPSRPTGRILSIEAGRRAQAIARDRGLRDHHVVHVARARKGEGAAEDRWVVLLDRVPHTRLKEAVVVEIGLEDGRLLRIREPENGIENWELRIGSAKRRALGFHSQFSILNSQFRPCECAPA